MHSLPSLIPAAAFVLARRSMLRIRNSDLRFIRELSIPTIPNPKSKSQIPNRAGFRERVRKSACWFRASRPAGQTTRSEFAIFDLRFSIALRAFVSRTGSSVRAKASDRKSKIANQVTAIQFSNIKSKGAATRWIFQ